MKKNIVDFNHISENIPKQDVDALMQYYRYYHKNLWCVKKMLQILYQNTASNIISTAANDRLWYNFKWRIIKSVLLIISGVGVSLAAT